MHHNCSHTALTGGGAVVFHVVFIGCAHVTAALPPAGDGLHAGGAFTAGHPRPAAALLPLSGRASAACDEELRDSHQSPGQVRGQTLAVKQLIRSLVKPALLAFLSVSPSGTSC